MIWYDIRLYFAQFFFSVLRYKDQVQLLEVIRVHCNEPKMELLDAIATLRDKKRAIGAPIWHKIIKTYEKLAAVHGIANNSVIFYDYNDTIIYKAREKFFEGRSMINVDNPENLRMTHLSPEDGRCILDKTKDHIRSVRKRLRPSVVEDAIPPPVKKQCTDEDIQARRDLSNMLKTMKRKELEEYARSDGVEFQDSDAKFDIIWACTEALAKRQQHYS